MRKTTTNKKKTTPFSGADTPQHTQAQILILIRPWLQLKHHQWSLPQSVHHWTSDLLWKMLPSRVSTAEISDISQKHHSIHGGKNKQTSKKKTQQNLTQFQAIKVQKLTAVQYLSQPHLHAVKCTGPAPEPGTLLPLALPYHKACLQLCSTLAHSFYTSTAADKWEQH